MKIYLDVDDTLSDFRGHAMALGVPPWEGTWYTQDPATWSQEQKDIQQATNDMMRRESFWMTMPVLPQAHELIAAAATRSSTYLLTAIPSFALAEPEMEKMIRRAKAEYAEQILHFPANRVVICQRKDKVQHAVQHGTVRQRNILVDDAAQNCREWAGAGGIEVFHTTCASSIRHLKELFGK